MRVVLAGLLAGCALLACGRLHAQASVSEQEAAAIAEICPQLPADSGLAWQLMRGPDFVVCYADMIGERRTAFAVYRGFHPSFKPEDEHYLGRGKVAGVRVRWYTKSAQEPGWTMARQTRIDTDVVVLHIWVGAASQPELDARLRILAAMRFQR